MTTDSWAASDHAYLPDPDSLPWADDRGYLKVWDGGWYVFPGEAIDRAIAGDRLLAAQGCRPEAVKPAKPVCRSAEDVPLPGLVPDDAPILLPLEGSSVAGSGAPCRVIEIDPGTLQVSEGRSPPLFSSSGGKANVRGKRRRKSKDNGTGTFQWD